MACAKEAEGRDVLVKRRSASGRRSSSASLSLAQLGQETDQTLQAFHASSLHVFWLLQFGEAGRRELATEL